METGISETGPETARLTADVALFSEHERTWHVLLIRRGWDPYAGCWALPGGHVDPGEQTHIAAHRELFEETGLDIGVLRYVGVYAEPGRDPRGRYVDFAYTQTVDGMPEPTAGDDASEARWVPVAEALSTAHMELAFDHGRIVMEALHTLGLSKFRNHAQ